MHKQTTYEVGTARQILRTFTDRTEAQAYVTTVQRGGFLPAAETSTLRIDTKVAR